MLKEARDNGNQELLAEVAHRYFNTRAGVEANERLATMLLDRSQYFLAALRFGRMLRLSTERFPVAEMTLFKAALAYRRAGDARNAGAVWQRLEDRVGARDGIRVGDQVIEPLTPKEQEVLGLLAELLTTEEIAATLFVSVNTVRTHIRSILRKLAVSRRNEAIRRARALSLLAG